MSGARETPGSPLLRPSTNGESNRRNSSDERQPLINQDAIERIPSSVSSYYEITEITEMGKMASLFFSRSGRNMFYICLVIYLYGDLAIYGAAVAKSVRDVACNYRPENMTSFLNISDTEVITTLYILTFELFNLLLLSHAGQAPRLTDLMPTEFFLESLSAQSDNLYSAM